MADALRAALPNRLHVAHPLLRGSLLPANGLSLLEAGPAAAASWEATAAAHVEEVRAHPDFASARERLQAAQARPEGRACTRKVATYG